MPRTEEKYIVALDIGTSKVCVLVGEINDRNQIEIIGKGTSPMKGTRRGNIINLDQAVDAVKKAVDEAAAIEVTGLTTTRSSKRRSAYSICPRFRFSAPRIARRSRHRDEMSAASA